jgi:uncharacterized membrane protein YphA (DoxX/SURF4 family)
MNTLSFPAERSFTKTKAILYWTTIVILEFVLLSGGIADIIQVKAAIDGMNHLGYPPYFAVILGVWKILGGIAILVPGFARVKEWAYAGIFFDFSGALISHAVLGDNVMHIITTLLFASIAVASWALRPASRKL